MTTTTLRTTTASAALLSIAMILLACANATAQPIKPAYNIGQYEYWIGGYDSPPHSDPDAIWPFMDSMGVTIPSIGNLFPPLPSNPLGVLLDTSDQWWHTGRRFLPTGPPQAFLAGFGREVVFYPFDSVQATLWPSKFLTKLHDTTEFNASEIDPISPLNGPREAIYRNSGTIGQIASTIAINAASLSARTFQKNKKLLAEQHTNEDPSRCAYIVLTGHLFDSLNSSNNNAAVVFRVAVYHQLEPSDHYLRDNLTVDSAGTSGLDILVDSFAVTRGQLLADTFPRQRYREISHRTDLYWRPHDNGPGPLHPSQPSGREQALDIRVYWTGAEKAALRSVAFRDSLGELVLGKSQNSITFRDSLIREARRILQGSPTAAPTAPLHPAIFRLEVGHENRPSAYAAYIAMDRLIRETFNKTPHATASDSVAAINVKDNPNAHWYQMSDQREHTIETYFNSPFDVDSMFGNFTTWKPMSRLFTVPHEAVPAIGEHNGGRFTIPETNVSDTGIENYESSIQRLMLGRAFAWQLPGDDQFPFSGNALSHLSEGATLCRDRRIRMVQFVGTVRSMDFRKNKPLTPEDTLMDTIMSHVPEAAELRAMANLGLAWNAKGITWWNFGDCIITNVDNGTRYQKCCMGNRRCDDLFGFQDNFDDTIPIHTGGYLLVPGLYVGRHNIMTEIQWLNKNWFDTIGGRLMYLTWRNAYSADASAPWPGSNEPADSITRPLPSSEIITEVKSYKLNDTIPDPTHRTFVEVGFFDKLTGQTSSQPDPKKDTHYVVVVNRRMFERPADISPTSARGQLMDSLAENRRIRLKFNLLRKDFAQYEFIHVREYAPDLTPLAGTSTQRTPTSVTIPADGYAEIALRPGGAALLEIVYKQPDESLIAGKLQTNNQHKMVYVNGRYYCVYTKDTTRWVNCPNMTPQPISSSFVFLRRSLPVDTTGTILWEPIEDSVDYDDPCNFLTDNLHPALTVRRTGLNGAFTVVTVTWTAHVRDTNSNVVRAVYARDIGIGSLGTRFFGNIERVAYYHPTDPTKVACNDVRNVWGTPGVTRTANGYFFVYSSATAGIVARVRKYTPGLLWPITGAYSGYDSISLYNGDSSDFGRSLYPSVPPFAHEALGDSTCGVVWQQPLARRVNFQEDAYSGDTIGLSYQIRYARLKQVPGAGGAPALAQSYRNFRFANNASGPVAIEGYTSGFNDYRNPCIDQTQDIYGRLQEMVTFQSLEGHNFDEQPWELFYALRLRSIYTDPQEKSWLWGSFLLFTDTTIASRPSDWVYKHGLNATVGSLNDLTAAVSTSPVAFFSIAYTTPDGSEMHQTTARYTEPLDSARKEDALYTYGGTYPQASCAPQHQATREAVLYQSGTGGTVLRTTRQFFARTRPSGYLAHGRSLAFSVDDSSRSAFHASLFDLWYATDSVSVPLHLAALPSYEHMELDSLPQVPVLFRTGAFQAHDSVQIGFSLSGEFGGEIDTLNPARVRLRLELMDAVADTVVAVVDSGSVTMAAPQHGRSGDSVLDLLSGSYYLRLRLDTMNIPAVVWNPNGAPVYPVVDIHGWMEDGGFGKVRREGAATTAEARISAQPNPFTATTEVRFSIPVSGTAAVRVFDPLGRPVAEVVPEQWMEVGRYAVEFDGSGLQPGTYLIELTLDQRRVVQKLVLAR